MTQIDYKKAFSKLSHIKALSHDQKFDQIVQNLITLALNQKVEENPKNEAQVAARINDIYGMSIRLPIILSNIDKLLSLGEITKDPLSKQLHVTPVISNKLKQRLEVASQLENRVKIGWYNELKAFNPDISDETLNTLWECLESYLCNVFEQHGIQTLHLLNPNAKIEEDDQKSLTDIIENIIKENNDSLSKEILIASINQFITNADETRTNFISQLADSTFTSFALTSDAETVNFLNERYNNLQLFLDTNFIFGILDLHKNSEDASAREILEEVKKNRLPFRLAYHPETLAEFKRAFDARALHIRASKWTRETSRVAITVDGLSPLEELFHKQNIDNEIDTSVFLDKYDHVDIILKDLGLIEYTPQAFTSDEEYVDIESDIEKYQIFYDPLTNRKPKSYLGFKHDVVVIREVRRLNPRKTKFLESHAFFISSDYILAKFEKKHYRRNWEINYVVSPSVFLQLIRPFIENDYSSNKRFIDTFSIPELRAFEIDYSSTRSKALQILNDNYHDTSFETKVKILRDQVILEKLKKANDDFSVQLEIIENQISIENQILTKQKEEALNDIQKIQKEKDRIEEDKYKVEVEKETALTEIEIKNTELKVKSEELIVLKNTHAILELKQQLEYKQQLLSITERNIESYDKRHPPIAAIIEKKLKNHRFYWVLSPVLFFAFVIFLIYKLSWEIMEPYTYIFSMIAALAGYLYFAINGDSFDPRKYFKYYNKGITSKIYSEFDFNIADLELQKETKKSLEDEIIGLKAEIQKKQIP
ncbi:hypothetical protein [Cytophaga hutchinsonii]|uniref:Uncharacterized protein n=1 Tax=Cytophaga hutchinsonii (strain ATCC 33406 / DSM 1761 / CIP 103989 / NBRC 15051 / NCIMB 9469 / D465) TaxID=269798 RepID=A0A6N4SM51_CYTH3|nr:hypothetical protein [Cytophaga hutchinsonii]ABG57327.1 conserved hypothetical protein [Cytophaga hutchinsonii ATCC 33406]SFX46441.1 hypothetical protein SAMN04487930_104226 [Cytophaga hutchinsonii ATCC 33406]